jgi:hypothetical protein
MILRLLTLLMLLAVLPAHAGISLSVTAQPGQRFVEDPAGTPLAAGFVWAGSFATGFDPAADALNPAALMAAWQPCLTTTVRPIFGEAGRFSDSTQANAPALTGKPIYLWIFTTSDAAAPRADLANVTGYGLFTAAAWTFPDGTLPPPQNYRQINSSEVQTALGAASVSATALRLQSFTSHSSRAMFDAAMLAFFPDTAAAVREPGADPDSDGLSNAVEFYLTRHPAQASGNPMEISRTEFAISVTRPRRDGLPPGTAVLAGSNDLVFWLPVPAHLLTETTDSGGLVTTSIPYSSGFRFFRFDVNLTR